MMLQKRFLIYIVLVFSVFLLLAACTPSDLDGKGSGTTDSSSATADGSTVDGTTTPWSELDFPTTPGEEDATTEPKPVTGTDSSFEDGSGSEPSSVTSTPEPGTSESKPDDSEKATVETEEDGAFCTPWY